MKRESIFPASLVAAAAFLRLWRLRQMEFKGDERESIELGLRLLRERPWTSAASWPRVGLPSSGGVDNPPFYDWLMALFWQVTGSPLGCTALIALANVLALPAIYLWARRAVGPARALVVLGWLALSPYAVIYSRKLWPPELLLPGVALLVWGVERWRAGSYWLGAGLMLWASLFFTHLHLSGSVFMAVLAVTLVADLIRRARAGQLPPLARPRWWEALLAAAGLGVMAFFTVPYLRYLATLSPGTLAAGMRLAWPEPQLLFRLTNAVVPLELEGHFGGHWSQLVRARSPNALWWILRWIGLFGAIYTAIPLALRGAYGWMRRPSAVPILGLAWIGFLLLFSLLQLPAFTQYVLVMFPLPALLIAGAFDPEENVAPARGWTWLRWAHVGLLGILSASTIVWVTGRGGSEGDYGVGYDCQYRQARAVIAALKKEDPSRFETAPRSAFSGGCHPLEHEVRWIARWLAPELDARMNGVRLCEGWLADGKGDVQYRWAVDRTSL